jgi:hypothetical protein
MRRSSGGSERSSQESGGPYEYATVVREIAGWVSVRGRWEGTIVRKLDMPEEDFTEQDLADMHARVTVLYEDRTATARRRTIRLSS